MSGQFGMQRFKETRRRRQAIERELAELNTLENLNLPPNQISTLIVSPMSTGNICDQYLFNV